MEHRGDVVVVSACHADMAEIMKHIALAIGVVLIGSADFELVARRDGHVVETMCAKSEAACEAAVDAIRKGWFAPMRRNDDLACERRDGCFSDRSLCIEGYSCRGTAR